MKPTFISSIISIFMIPHAYATLENLKTLSVSVDQTNNHRALSHGCVAFETELLKRIALFGPGSAKISAGTWKQADGDEMTRLLQHFLQLKDGQLYPVHNKSSLGAHIPPAMVADLMLIYENRLKADEPWQKNSLQEINTIMRQTSTGKITAAKLATLLKTLEKTRSECRMSADASYLPTLPHLILSGYVYSKAEKQDAYNAFLTRFKEHGYPVCNVSADEKALYETIERTYYQAALPPRVRERDVYFNNEWGHDCTETTLRELCNLIVYNRHSTPPVFDVTLLPPSIKPSDDIVSFYAKYAKTTSVNGDPTSSSAWIHLLAHHSNVDYKKNGWVVLPTMSNIITLMNRLYNLPCSTFGELCAALSTPRCILTCNKEEHPDHETVWHHITLSGADFPEPYPIIMKLHVSSSHGFNHGCIERSKGSLNSHSTDQSLLKKLIQDLIQSPFDQRTHTMLATVMPQNADELRTVLADIPSNLPYATLMHLYYMMDLEDDAIELMVLDDACSKLNKHPQLEFLIQRLITPEGDEQACCSYLECLARHKVYEYNQSLCNRMIELMKSLQDATYISKAIILLKYYAVDKNQQLAQVLHDLTAKTT